MAKSVDPIEDRGLGEAFTLQNMTCGQKCRPYASVRGGVFPKVVFPNCHNLGTPFLGIHPRVEGWARLAPGGSRRLWEAPEGFGRLREVLGGPRIEAPGGSGRLQEAPGGPGKPQEIFYIAKHDLWQKV